MMRKILTIFLIFILLAACKDKPEEEKYEPEENSIFDKSYQNYTEIEFLEDYRKIADTVIYGEEYEPGFRLTGLQKEDHNLVLFNMISLDEKRNTSYRIIDTLVITNLQPDEYISIGYCQNEFIDDEEIISVVEETESRFVEKINRAWRANIETGEFEKIPVDGIECWNKYFQEPNE